MRSQPAYEFADSMDKMAGVLEASFPELLKAVEPLVEDAVIENFARQESPEGVAWPERKKLGDGHPLLVETQTEGSGSLFGAATGQAGGHVSRIEGDTLIFGVDKDGGIGGIPGAGVHNYGYPEKNIPQREFLGVSEEGFGPIDDLITNRCDDLIGTA